MNEALSYIRRWSSTMGQHDKRRASISSSSPSEEGVDTDDNYLEPFVHQVGGHGSVLCWDETTVCKPYSTRERLFYECMPPQLKQFTAEFKGVIEVGLYEDNFGYLTLNAYAPKIKPQESSAAVADSQAPKKEQLFNPTPRKRRNTKIKLHRSGSLELEHSGPTEDIFTDDTVACDGSGSSSFFHQNPWAIQCQTRHLTKMRRKHGDKHQFLLLENLASRFRLPCVLDLKMGTQQHGIDASEAKRKSQSLKCQRSTSSVIGVRLCGMQVYHKRLGVFKCHNKYYGRSLNVDGFKEEIGRFFHNGETYRTDLFETSLMKLEALYEQLVENSDGCRFFASSLLIIYDGKENMTEPPYVEIRMIDFEHSTFRGFRTDPPYDGPDRGYISGLKYLVSILRDMSNTLVVDTSTQIATDSTTK